MARLHNKNWERAREYFGIAGDENMVLHHVDQTLRKRDPERYLEWRPEDLVAIEKGEHTRIHHGGKVVSAETRRKISENHVGFAGKKHSESTKQKLREKLAGVPKSDETRKKMRDNHARLRGRDNPSAKRILCVELGRVFYGAAEASRALGISASGINRCCNNIPNYKTAGGYHWRYEDA